MMVLFKGLTLKAENYDCVEINGQFDRSAWMNAKPELKKLNPLMNLPYVRVGESGRVVTQSNACYLYLGRQLNLLGKSDDELTDCEQLLCEVMDVRNNVVGYSYGRTDISAEKWIASTIAPNGSIDKLKCWMDIKYPAGLTDDSKPSFFVGETATAPDFHIWEMLDQITNIAKFNSLPDPFANSSLGHFHKSFRNLTENKRYFDSKLSELPANNLSASNFGATPNGAKWVVGAGEEARFWKDSAGFY